MLVAPHVRPSSTSNALFLCTGGSRSLVAASLNRITIGHHSLPLSCAVAAVVAFAHNSHPSDLIFVLARDASFALLAVTDTVATICNGSITDTLARPSDAGTICLVDPSASIIAIHQSQGSLTVIPITKNSSVLGEPFVLRLDELLILNIVFLHSEKLPTIAILFQDAKEARYVVQYAIDPSKKSLSQLNPPTKIQNHSSLMIPLPLSVGGGLLVVAQNCIAWHSPLSQKIITAPIKPTLISSYASANDNGKFLIGDFQGNLLGLSVVLANGIPKDIQIELLGKTVQSSCIAFDPQSNSLFVGSHYGDSHLYKLNLEASSDQCIEIVDTLQNLSPITDFCLVDNDNHGQQHLIACSGTDQDATLRIIRSGIGIHEIGRLDDIPELTAIFSLRPFYASPHDSILAISFVSETRFQSILPDQDALSELTSTGNLILDQPTLAIQNVPGDNIIQITPSSILLLSTSFNLIASWTPSQSSINSSNQNLKITHASIHENLILISITGGHIVLLQSSPSSISQLSAVTLNNEISCLHILNLPSVNATLCAIGTWNDNTIHLFSCPSLQQTHLEQIPGEIISRSILLVEFDNSPYLLVSLGDGQLFNFRITPSFSLSNRNKVTLGTQPITLRPFTINGNTHVFASSDRPTVIHSKSGHLLYSNVNLRHVTHITPFNSVLAHDAIVVCTDTSITIGVMDDIQKLHIKSIPTGETSRRIAYDESTGTIAIASIRQLPSPSTGLTETYHIVLRDMVTYGILDSMPLHPHEISQSIACINLQNGDGDAVLYYVVGTGFSYPHEEEPSRGRILVMQVTDSTRNLALVHEYEVRGNVYAITTIETPNIIIASVNSKLCVFEWNAASSTFSQLSTQFGHVACLCLAARGDMVCVGDLMKSVALLRYNNLTKSLDFVARDHVNRWVTALEFIDNDTILVGDSSGNLVGLRIEMDAEIEGDDQYQLTSVMLFGLGDMVNRMRRGTVTSTPESTETVSDQIKPQIVYATVNGSLGTVSTLDPKAYRILNTLQSVVIELVPGIGHFKYSEWRKFRTTLDEKDAVGIVDATIVIGVMDLDNKKRDEVMSVVVDKLNADMNSDGSVVTADDVMKLVEEVSRIH